ncbi:MAG: hypothetical protein LBC82_02010 [Oscillospiraceae bacterium]|nr:hypothetical protein [Oscillospiraceae bacterium]
MKLRKLLACFITVAMVATMFPLMTLFVNATTVTIYDIQDGDELANFQTHQGTTFLQGAGGSREFNLVATPKTVTVTERTADWHGIDIKPEAFNAQAGDTFNITVTGSLGTEAGLGVRIVRSAGDNSWLQTGVTGADGAFSLSYSVPAEGENSPLQMVTDERRYRIAGVENHNLTINGLIITRTPGTPPPSAVDLDGNDTNIPNANLRAGAGVAAHADGNGRFVANTTNWTQRNVFFDVNWVGATLDAYKSITFTYTGHAGDFGSKQISVIAGTGNEEIGTVNTGGSGGELTFNIPSAYSGNKTPDAITFRFGTGGTDGNNGGLLGTGVDFSITNVKFNKADDCTHVWNESHMCTAGCGMTHASGTGHNSQASNNTGALFAACDICGKEAVFTLDSSQSGHWPNQFGNSNPLHDRGIQTNPNNATLNEHAHTLRITTNETALTTSEISLIVERDGVSRTVLNTSGGSGVFTAPLPNGFFPTTVGWGNFGLNYTGTNTFTFIVELLAECGCVVFGTSGVVGNFDPATCPHSGNCSPCSVCTKCTNTPTCANCNLLDPCLGTCIPKAPIFDTQDWQIAHFNPSPGTNSVETGAIFGVGHTLKITSTSTEGFLWGARITFGDLGMRAGFKYTITMQYLIPAATRNNVGGMQWAGSDQGNFPAGVTAPASTWINWPGEDTWVSSSIELTVAAGTVIDPAATLRLQPGGGAPFISGSSWYICSLVVIEEALCTNHTWGGNFICTTPGCGARKPACNPRSNCNYTGQEDHICTDCGFEHPETTAHSYNAEHNCRICGHAHTTTDHNTDGDNGSCTICFFGHPCASGHTFVRNSAGNQDTHRCEHGCIVFAVTDTNDGTWARCDVTTLTGACTVCAGPHPCAAGHAYQNNRPAHQNHGCSRGCGLLANGTWENCFVDAQGNCPCGFNIDISLLCPGCNGATAWSWGNNDSSHWANGCACPWNAPHAFVNGVCVCGFEQPPDPCANGHDWVNHNADVHGCSRPTCTAWEAHSFNAQGLCFCGARGTPTEVTGLCASQGHAWEYINEDVHGCSRSECTAWEPHNFVDGKCVCGAVVGEDGGVESPEDFIPAPPEGGETPPEGGTTPPEGGTTPPGGGTTPPGGGDAPPPIEYDPEDFVDDNIFLDILEQDNPVIFISDLVELGGTVISAEALQAIAASGKDVEVVLENGFSFTILANSISADAAAFDLNIVVEMTRRAELIEGVRVPANSIVISPNFAGDFGFEIKFTFTAEQLAEAGINGNNAWLYHVNHNGAVTPVGRAVLLSDGSVEIVIDHASFYVLSEEAPIGTDPDDNNPGTGTTLAIAAMAVSAAAAIMSKGKKRRK